MKETFDDLATITVLVDEKPEILPMYFFRQTWEAQLGFHGRRLENLVFSSGERFEEELNASCLRWNRSVAIIDGKRRNVFLIYNAKPDVAKGFASRFGQSRYAFVTFAPDQEKGEVAMCTFGHTELVKVDPIMREEALELTGYDFEYSGKTYGQWRKWYLYESDEDKEMSIIKDEPSRCYRIKSDTLEFDLPFSQLIKLHEDFRGIKEGCWIDDEDYKRYLNGVRRNEHCCCLHGTKFQGVRKMLANVVEHQRMQAELDKVLLEFDSAKSP